MQRKNQVFPYKCSRKCANILFIWEKNKEGGGVIKEIQMQDLKNVSCLWLSINIARFGHTEGYEMWINLSSTEQLKHIWKDLSKQQGVLIA